MKNIQPSLFVRAFWITALICFGTRALAQSAPTITSVSPLSGTVKRNVTITGTNFLGTGITSRTVRLNGVVVPGSLSVSATRIGFTIPAGATSGPISVQTNLGTATFPTNFTVAAGPPPANDNLANAQILAGASGSFIGDTANATKELGEPNHAGDPGGASVWFSWTAPTSGLFLFNPHDSSVTTNFGVNLAIYTGTTMSNLSLVGSGASGIPFSRYTSAVVLNATAGVTYLIAMDGFTGIMGDYKLAWSPLTPPTSASFSPTSGYSGQSITITGDGFVPGTQVTVGGVAVSQSRVTVNTPTSITVSQVPSTASIGLSPITVTTPAGTAASSTSFNVLTAPPPSITSFTPSSASAGSTITITGTALWLGDGTVPTVTFSGGVAASTVTLTSSTSIAARVPSGATSGLIKVQTAAGTGTSSASLNVTTSYLSPVISSFSPTNGQPGDTVTITGQNFYGPFVSVSFNGTPTTFTTDLFGVVITATVPSGATSGPITVNNPAGSATTSTVFTVGSAPPTITGFTPSTITDGGSVTITGTNFTGAYLVSFNGTGASAFTVNSSTQITATVPAGPLTNGPISVFTPNGTATSASSFTYAPPPPTISNFSPTLITDGLQVTLTGTNFYNVQSVAFNGVNAASFTVDSPTQIVAVVPTGPILNGPISVTTAGGTGTSAAAFAYVGPPTITSFSPTVLNGSAPVVITGTNFVNVSAVLFNGSSASSWTVDSPTQITAIPPFTQVVPGPIRVVTDFGTAVSSASFSYSTVPTIASFSPTTIAPGSPVVITGTNLFGIQSVRFNGVTASFTVNSSTQITATAPTTLNPGAITITTGNGTATSPTNYSVTLAPIITGFSTPSGPVGRIITVTGANFTGTGISNPLPKFNDLSVGSFSVSSNSVTFAVPVGATTGPITMQTSQGLATSPFTFTVLASGAPPANDNFANAQVITGTTGTFNGNNVFATKEPGEPNHSNNPGGASVWFSWTAPQSGLFLFNPSNSSSSQFGIMQSIYTGSSVSSLTLVASGLTPTNIFARYGSAAVLNAVAGTTYYIALDGYNGVMADYRLTWSLLAAPTISSFSPSGATAGQTITVSINGTNFTPGAPINFGGGIADPSKVTYQTQSLITVSQVPITALTGPILVTTPAGVAVSPASFNVTPPPAPTIAGFTPDVGPLGAVVTINGTNFAGTSAVRFNGAAATSFTVDNTGQHITTSVPASASSGLITVVTPGGTATSATPFTVATPPVIAQQPQSQTTTYGQSVTFTVGATSVLPLTYDWRKNGVSLGGANPTASTASLVISPATMADAAVYDCVVTNALGSVVSAAVTLTVNPASATVTLAGLTATYDGSPKPVTVTTNPSGLSVQILYDNSPTAPTNAGPHQVVATITDPNYVGAAAAYLVINQAAAAISLTDLTAAYNGSPRTATVTTVPAGLNVNVTYGGLLTAPTNAGVYAAVATINDLNYSGSVSGTFTIAKASATVTLNNLATTYDGTAKSVTASTTPANLATSVTYDGNAASPTNAGSYAVAVTVTDPNYTGSASGTLSIAKAPATVSLSDLNQTYDGAPKPATATTTPTSLPVTLTYDGIATAPTNAGSYSVEATVNHANYSGSISGTLVIAKQPVTIALSDLVQAYNGQPHVVTATTTPSGLDVALTYNDNATAPTNPGGYAVVATVDDANHHGTTSDTLVVTIPVLVRHAPSINGGLDGSLQVLLGEDIALNGTAYISGDLLVPGTPTITLNGHPTFVGTRDGTGNTSPSNYQVALGGNALLRYLVRRTDAIALPTVVAPPIPAGTHDVALTSSGQVALPAGTYGNVSASGNSVLTLGVADATAPSIYNLQSLALTGSAQLQVIGPVVINLANGVTLASPAGNSAHPEWLTLNVAAGGVTLNGGATLHGFVVAPNGTVTINGGATLHGGVSSDRLTINGNGLLGGVP